jgi:putative oxidoreductase
MKFKIQHATDPLSSTSLLMLRVVVGLAFMHHGWHKIQDPLGWMGPSSSMPGFLQALAALSEFGGGAAWVLGLLVPVASLGILSTMLVALSKHLGHGDQFVSKPPSYELALVYACVALVMLFVGPGQFSIDGFIRRRSKEKTPGTSGSALPLHEPRNLADE